MGEFVTTISWASKGMIREPLRLELSRRGVGNYSEDVGPFGGTARDLVREKC